MSMQDLTGQTLDQYQILEQIGEGGMATVYKAYQPSLERNVALKILPPYFMHEAGFAKRFEREAKAIAQLVHPNILPIYDFGRAGDLSYIVMRYVDAGTLKDRMAQSLALPEIVRIVDNLASALDYAHEQGLIHRDVKPGNVLIDERGWVLLSDFGLAKMVEGSQALTGSGVGVGTPSYMSPEQGQGLQVDHRTDVYSLGVMLYEMVVGRVPYDAETPFAIVLKHIADPLPLPRKINPNLPEAVEQVILKAMAKSPDDRFNSAGDLAAALRKAVASAPDVPVGAAVAPAAPVTEMGESLETAVVEAPSDTVIEPVAPARWPPWLVWGAAAAALLLLLVVAAIVVRATRQRGLEATPAPVEATEAPALARDTEAPATATPATGQPAEPQPGEAPIPPELLTPPSQGLSLSTCDANQTQICISKVGQPRPFDSLSVGMEVAAGTAWSPTGERILFTIHDAGNYDLWTVAREGDDLRALANQPNVNEMNAAWSPTGEWIAFHRNGAPYLIHPDGQGLTQIPLPGEFQGCMPAPAWSPDGRQLAFRLDDNNCVDPEGRSSMKVTLVAINWDGTHARPLAEWETSKPGDMRVAWSPDGQFVAYQPQARQKWFLARADGSGESFAIDRRPDWWFPDFLPPRGQPQPPAAVAGPPPEGTMLEDCGDDKGHICLRPADGDPKSILVNEDFWFRGPSWSPDGGQIVVSASDRGDPYGQGASWASGDLYRLDTACLGQPQTCRDSLYPITAGTGDNDIHPAWSPDGEWIAFHRNGDLAVVRPDGSTSTNYNFDTAERCVIEPAWSPDSRQIVFFSVVGGCDKQPPFDLEVRVVGLDQEGDRAIWRERVVDYPWGLAWSPDGRAVAARVRLENRDQWLLISLPDGAVNEMPNEPVWWLPEHWPPWGGDAPTIQPSAAEPPQDPWGVVHLPPGQPIVIGLATALSGPVAEIGEGVRNATQLAADQAAEIHGHPIQLMIGDSACNPDDGLAVARDFAATPEVVGVVGHLCSIASMAASSVYQEAHIVMISPASTAVGLTHQGFEVVHRTAVHDALQGTRAAEYAREGLGVQRAAVVNSGGQFEQAAAGFQERFSSMGGEVAYFQTLPGDIDDFAQALAEIQAAGVQALYYAGNSANFVRQAREMLGDRTLIVMENAVVTNEFRAGAGDALEGTVAIAHAFDPESPIARPFVQAFMSRYDYRPSAYMGNAYDAVNLLLAAVDDVAIAAEGGELFIGRQALVERVRNTHDFPGVSGPITFDENGDRTSAGLRVFLFRDGAWMPAP